MFSKTRLMKKHWKPPYVALLLILVIACINRGQTQNSTEDLDDGIEIIVETSPYSLKFDVKDTQKYRLDNVTCRNTKNAEQTENQDHICENLDPCSAYVAVLTIMQLGEEIPKIIERTESTDYIEPTVQIVDIENGIEEINITWVATDKTCISYYEIEVKSIEKEYRWKLYNDQSALKIDGLNPCQEHNISLKTTDVNNNLISNLTTTNSTLYAEPGNVTVSIVPYENAQIQITWQPPKYKTCIDYYYLKWFVEGCTKEDYRNLSVFDTRAKNMENSSAGKADDSRETSAPDNPAIETEHGIPFISTCTGDGELETYLPTPHNCFYIADDVCEWFANITDQNANQYIIGGLQGCETYGFQIYINSNISAMDNDTKFTAPEQVPGVVIAEMPEIASTNITLRWSPPKTNRKCVSYYEVYVTGPLQRNELQETNDTVTEDTDALFVELDPCGQYNYTIIPRSLNGSVGIAMNSTFETMEAKPSPVRNINVLAEPFALNISWQKPAFADLCLNGYRLSGWRDENNPATSFDKKTTDTHVKIDGLYSCQSYTVQIIPTTKAMDGELQRIDTETGSIAAQAPTSFQAIGLYPDRFELSAQDSDVNNTCVPIYARFVCELSKWVDVPYKTAEEYVEGQVGGISFKALLSPLSPYTDYKCNVALFNVAGWSPNRTIIARTEPYFPDRPEFIDLKESTNDSLSFSWIAPKYANGNIKLYISQFQRVEAAYYIPPACSPVTTYPTSRETSSLEQSFTGLLPYTTYSIQVAAQNEYGVGEYTRPFLVKTDSWISEPVTNLRVIPEGPYVSDTEYKANVVVSWISPCKSNGEIEYFILEFLGERYDYEREHFQRSVIPVFDADGGLKYNETNLRAQYNYTVSVAVKTKSKSLDLTSPEISGTFDAPAGIPKRLNETAVSKMRVDAHEANNPTNSAVVRFPADILDTDSGTIIYMALLLSEKVCAPEPQLRFAAINPNQNWPETRSWNDAYKYSDTDCVYQYQTTPLFWKPTRVRSSSFKSDSGPLRAKTNDDDIKYIIGTEKCEGTTGEYCNGPLKADTEYHLVIRLFTKSGYNDAAMLEFRTEALMQFAVIIISVISCMLLALIAGLLYLWITKRIIWHRESCNGIEDAGGDIMAKNFAIFYRDISKPEKISREFKELTVVALDLSYSASELGCNKNRYADIYPYDKNRVILDIDSLGSDYINASFIDGYRRKKEYIAAQGPKPETIMDFWRMVVQHNVRVIVMVTQFREGDVVKCHEYFPFKSKSINVSVKKKDFFELYDRTEITITHDTYGLKQKVVHLYFKKWPDHGCPTDPMSLITFVRKVKAEKVPSYSPIVVHCSAGVGRTGTFIGLDIIVQHLRSESKINIYETVKKLRFQRMKMVQTLAQYTFLYSCAYELVKHKGTRAALKYQTKNSKKVSFQDDPVALMTVGTMPTKFHGRRNGSDLSSVDEEHDDAESIGKPVETKRTDTNSYGNVPIRFGVGTKGCDLESLDEQMENNEHLKGNSTESAM